VTPRFDPRDLVVGESSTLCIGAGECVAEAIAAWIGMALKRPTPPHVSYFGITRCVVLVVSLAFDVCPACRAWTPSRPVRSACALPAWAGRRRGRSLDHQFPSGVSWQSPRAARSRKRLRPLSDQPGEANTR